VSTSREVFERCKEYQSSDREMLLALYLNPRNDLLHVEVHSVGTVDTTSVYPREIVRLALVKSASAVILVHNHPSGDPEPSSADKQITKAVYFACRLLDIKMLDHIILGSGTFYSFAGHGAMDDAALTFDRLGL
jgi:DNA repair protein RadC